MTPSAFRALPDSDQDEMVAYVRDICPACGNLRSICSDEERSWFPQRSMCYATAARELTERRVAKRYGHPDEKATSGLHPVDGMNVWAAADDLTPDDNFV